MKLFFILGFCVMFYFKGGIMKKITYTIFSFLFLILASFFIFSSNRNEISYGEGKETSEKITTFLEYETMISEIRENIGFSKDVEEPSDENAYNSFTWIEEVYSKIYYSTARESVNSEVNITLHYCFNNGMTYYKIYFRNYFTQKRGDLSDSGILTMEFEYFIDDLSVLFKLSKYEFNSVNLGTSSPDSINEAFGFNKWYDITLIENETIKDAVDNLRDTDYLNQSIVKYFLDYINKYENVKFIENNNVFKLENEDFKDLLKDYLEIVYTSGLFKEYDYGIEKYGGNLTVDLSKPKAPVLYTEMSFQNNIVSTYTYDTVTIKNINNTVITKPKQIETFDLSNISVETESNNE